MTSPQELARRWQSEAAALELRAKRARNNGLYDTAVLITTKAETLKECAETILNLPR